MSDDQPDTAKEVKPVLMFDDKERDQGKGVKDFRPISEVVEKHRGRSRISDAPPDPENPLSKPDIAPPKVTVGSEGDHAVELDVPDPEEIEIPEDESSNPPATAPTPEAEEKNEDEGAPSEPTDEDEDDIPSPWDEPTSD